MASTIHPAPSMQAPPSFSRDSTSMSMNGMQLSQSHLGSFDASQSVASTPAATPPPPRAPLQQSVSFNMGGNMMNSVPAMRQGYGAPPVAGQNGYGYQMQHPPGFKPQIYTVRHKSLLSHPSSQCYLEPLLISNQRPSTQVSRSMKWK